MENIEIAKVCGLCAGCKFAIKSAEDCLKTNNNVTLFKEVVHNKSVNNSLKEKGINVKNNLSDLCKDEVVILRAHGEPPETYNYLSQNEISFVDCTCINVKKIHSLVQDYSNNGYRIIIIGKYGSKSGKMHPEIFGTIGWCNGKGILIEDDSDLAKLEDLKNEKLYVVCQTTFNIEKADSLIEKIKQIATNSGCEIVINKSICGAQRAINKASVSLAKQVDLMIVIGSEMSSNSAELAKNVSTVAKTIFFEDITKIKDELIKNNITLTKDIKIGLTAGASTDTHELLWLKDVLQNMIDNLD